MRTIGEELKFLMDKFYLKSVRELERKTGVSNTYLGMLIKGEDPRTKKPISPTLDTIKGICDGLKFPLTDFLEDIGYLTERTAERDIRKNGPSMEEPFIDELDGIDWDKFLALTTEQKKSLVPIVNGIIDAMVKQK